jgi:hypothetical protein
VQQEKVLKSIHQPTIHPSTNHPGFTQFISHQNPMTYIYTPLFSHGLLRLDHGFWWFYSSQLVGGWPPARKKIRVRQLRLLFPIYGNIKFMFQDHHLPWIRVMVEPPLLTTRGVPGACDKASRRSSPVMPILSPFGGWNLEGNNNPWISWGYNGNTMEYRVGV